MHSRRESQGFLFRPEPVSEKSLTLLRALLNKLFTLPNDLEIRVDSEYIKITFTADKRCMTPLMQIFLPMTMNKVVVSNYLELTEKPNTEITFPKEFLNKVITGLALKVVEDIKEIPDRPSEKSSCCLM